MLPEVRTARVLDAIRSHQAKRLSCVEAGELLGLSERQSAVCGTPMRSAARKGWLTIGGGA
jgi:hypothetical protein